LSQYPQFPSPYVPPTPDSRYWQPMFRGRGPAGTASILQIILASLTLLTGTCIGTLLWARGIDAFLSEMQQQGMKLPEVPGENVVDILRFFFVVFTSAAMLIGTSLLILAVFVRQGKRPAIITSLILVGIISLVLSMDFIGGLLQMNPFVVVIGAGLFLAAATITKLVQALRSWPDPYTAGAMQQAWMWMMQQQSTGGYGYGYGPEQAYPPPPAPLPPPPSDQQQPPPSA
jgi:hypothetical protein